jgi:CheY-like chemotaxis protein
MPNPPLVLHIEDDVDAAFFLQRAVEKSHLGIELHHLQNGEEAISFLDKVIASLDHAARIPSLLLLDLKMPFKDGFEVLEWIRQRELLRPIPVFILTSSDRNEDLRRASEMGATGYLTKTVTFNNVIETIKTQLHLPDAS